MSDNTESDDEANVTKRQFLTAGIGGTVGLTAGCLQIDSDNTGGANGSSQDQLTTTGTDTQGESTSTNTSTETQSQLAESDTPSGSITFNDQTTDGSYVDIARVETNVVAIIQIYDSQGEFLANPGIRFEPGEVREDIRITPSESLSGNEQLSAQLFWCEESGPNTCDGPRITTASATITVESATETQEQATESTTPSGSVGFHDQTTDGSYIDIARVETNVEAVIQVYDSQGEFLANPGLRFEPGEVREDIRINLSTPLSQSQELSVQLFWCEESDPDTCNGPRVTTASATITVE